ncbi:MAG: hypothetical protein HY726_10505 [Candidatus Rokubacteria bacterium]|nr:hypothetical protein [Candidatus Rokubacteria bacterium]
MAARRSVVLALLFIGLMLLAQVQYGLAIVDEVWDSILSWDNPASQAVEDAASLTPPRIDPALQACDHITASAGSCSGRLFLAEWPASAQSPASSPRIIRPPPTA